MCSLTIAQTLKIYVLCFQTVFFLSEIRPSSCFSCLLLLLNSSIQFFHTKRKQLESFGPSVSSSSHGSIKVETGVGWDMLGLVELLRPRVPPEMVLAYHVAVRHDLTCFAALHNFICLSACISLSLNLPCCSSCCDWLAASVHHIHSFRSGSLSLVCASFTV